MLPLNEKPYTIKYYSYESQAYFCYVEPSNQNTSKLFWRRIALVMFEVDFFIYIWSWEWKHPIIPYIPLRFKHYKAFLTAYLPPLYTLFSLSLFLSSTNYSQFLSYSTITPYWICNENRIIAHISDLLAPCLFVILRSSH